VRRRGFSISSPRRRPPPPGASVDGVTVEIHVHDMRPPPRRRRLWPWVVGGALVGAPWLLIVPALSVLVVLAVAVQAWPLFVAAWLIGLAVRVARRN
jgi:hypothetical protein